MSHSSPTLLFCRVVVLLPGLVLMLRLALLPLFLAGAVSCLQVEHVHQEAEEKKRVSVVFGLNRTE